MLMMRAKFLEDSCKFVWIIGAFTTLESIQSALYSDSQLQVLQIKQQT